MQLQYAGVCIQSPAGSPLHNENHAEARERSRGKKQGQKLAGALIEKSVGFAKTSCCVTK